MSYEVVNSQALRDQVGQLAQEAWAHGQGPAFAPAWQALTGLLAADPLGAGELEYYTTSGVPVFLLGRGPLVVNYAVYVGNRKVWITKVVRLLAPGE
jgi:hypothetical protein